MMLSPHIALEVANAVHLGHRPGDALPLALGDPVPACGCPSCTGVSADDPARRTRRRTYRQDRPLPVEDARALSILDVAGRLGLGEPARRGREWAVLCPLHDDTQPSLTLDLDRSLWYCFGCSEGGDGIELVQRVRNCSFAEAVRELAA